MKKFPENFHWGAATASFQVEGWNENTDWAEAAKQDKVPAAGRLSDHYHRYEEDFDLILELGHNAHRFSIEWARIEPREGEFDLAEIEHYRDVLKALRKRNIVPYITLWHFTLPTWLAESGGFEREDIAEVFARYCAKVVEEMGDLCTRYATINEPNVWAGHGWIYGAWPPFKRGKIGWKALGKEDGSTRRVGSVPRWSNVLMYLKVERHLVAAHIAAYKEIKKVNPDAEVSIVKHVRWFTSNWNPVNMLKARVMQYFQTYRLMNKIKGHLDRIGLNYYRHTKFGDNKNYLQTDMGWDIYPSGIYGALICLKRYNLPIVISEAGIADEADTMRADYITMQLKAVHKAIESGVDVRGFMYWSLMDNYEWALGTSKRFGLIEIDYQTLERTVRPSAYVYKDIIKHNGLS